MYKVNLFLQIVKILTRIVVIGMNKDFAIKQMTFLTYLKFARYHVKHVNLVQHKRTLLCPLVMKVLAVLWKNTFRANVYYEHV